MPGCYRVSLLELSASQKAFMQQRLHCILFGAYKQVDCKRNVELPVGLSGVGDTVLLDGGAEL